MVTGDIYPIGDATPNDWGALPDVAHYLNINEDKGSPNSDMIFADQIYADDNELDQFTFETIDNIQDNSITQVVVWTYGRRPVGVLSPEVAISWNGGVNFTVYTDLAFTDVNSWHDVTYAGLSYSKSDLDQFQVSYQADCPDKLTRNEIYSIYVEVTYTEAVSGWAHKFLGVAGASIGNISGVPIANVGKVKGVAK